MNSGKTWRHRKEIEERHNPRHHHEDGKKRKRSSRLWVSPSKGFTHHYEPTGREEQGGSKKGEGDGSKSKKKTPATVRCQCPVKKEGIKPVAGEGQPHLIGLLVTKGDGEVIRLRVA